jgi:uncharacterized phage protein (TIGR02218 family)
LTYDSREISSYFGQPFELYWFATADKNFYFTSADHAITYLSNEYIPVSIKRTQTNQTAEAKGGSVRVTVDKDNPVAELFIAFSPSTPLFLVIYRGHEGDSDVVVNFTGKVTMTVFGDFAELTAIPESDVLKNSIPAMAFQAPCNHFLYDSGCGINKSDFATAGTIATIDATGQIITVAAAGSKVNGWFTVGYVEIGQQRRMIMLHSGSTLKLIAPLFGVEVGDAVTLYAGCMRDFNTCKTKFDNAKNYLGFQWIPAKNPFKDPFY